MSEVEVVEIVDHHLTTDEEKYFTELWLKGFELSLARANDALSRAITLGTALAGGSLVLLKEDICYGWWKIAAAALFLVALAVAIYGSTPMLSAAPLDHSITQRAYTGATIRKAWYAKQSMRLLILGLLVAIVGAAARQALPR